MIVRVLKVMLMHAQPVSIEKTPSTKRQRVDEPSYIIQPKPKRAQTEVNRSSIERNRGSITEKSRRSIKHAFKNYYRWNAEHLINFPWLHYNVADQVTSCQFAGCKMYHAQFLHITW